MCFTVAIDLVREELEHDLQASFPAGLSFEPAYFFSAFDRPHLPVITSARSGEVQLARWGLVPRWVNDCRRAEEIAYRTFNARIETLTQKPAYRHLVGRRHCLLPVTGFYEWHQEGSRKSPWFIRRRDRKPFLLGGLYDRWADPETGELWITFTLVTLPASPLLARVHNTQKRMPLLLGLRERNAWLATLHPDLRHLPLLSDEELQAYPVAPDLWKRARNDPRDPLLIRPWEDQKGPFDRPENGPNGA